MFIYYLLQRLFSFTYELATKVDYQIIEGRLTAKYFNKSGGEFFRFFCGETQKLKYFVSKILFLLLTEVCFALIFAFVNPYTHDKRIRQGN